MLDKNNNLYIEHYNEQSFDFLTWRYGSLMDTLRIPHREYTIYLNKEYIRKYVIGYCKADNVPCRPKKNHVAVMFNNESINNWWTHLTRKEFRICFPELKKL